MRKLGNLPFLVNRRLTKEILYSGSLISNNAVNLTTVELSQIIPSKLNKDINRFRCESG